MSDRLAELFAGSGVAELKATAEALRLSAVSEPDPHKRNLLLRRVKAATLLAKAVEAMPKDRPVNSPAPDPKLARVDREKLRREAIERTRITREKFNELRKNAPRVKIKAVVVRKSLEEKNP